jgi:predicted RNA-binding protein associated with RNAse of E/G family
LTTPGSVRVVYTKWDGRLHWHFRLDFLGEDEHGIWLASRPGTLLQRGHEPPKAELDGFALLVPRTGSWIAAWHVEDDPEIYVDVTTTPRRSDAEVTAVDLDLDVIRRRDGSVALLDEDEFDEHRVLFGYPPAVVDAAIATARQLADVIAQRIEPFGIAAGRWLSQVVQAG